MPIDWANKVTYLVTKKSYVMKELEMTMEKYLSPLFILINLIVFDIILPPYNQAYFDSEIIIQVLNRQVFQELP